LSVNLGVCEEGISTHSTNRVRNGNDLMTMSSGYRQVALKLILNEANAVARELNLEETLPITESNLIDSYISPPRMARLVPGFGNITTSNYIYYITVGNKFSFLEWTRLQEELPVLEKKYLLPLDKMNTNAAYEIATQLLAKVSINVSALSRDCDAYIVPLVPTGETGKHFVPIYTVYWQRKREVGSAAEIEFLVPTKAVLALHVMKSEYILRKPLSVPNAEPLLSQTNSFPDAVKEGTH